MTLTPDSPMVKDIIKAARENLKSSPGGLMPVFFIGSDHDCQVLGCSWETADDKDRVVAQVRWVANKSKADFVLFVSESWMIGAEHADHFMKNRDKYPEVRLYPHRQEAVMFVLETEMKTFSGKAPILKNREMGEVEWLEMKAMEGRFTGFPSKKRT